jgi:beta-glucanase (GH16 family)
MENVGYDPAGFHFSLHSQNFNFQRKEQRTSVTNLAHPDAFHKFGLDWRAHSITFYVDGKVVYAVKVGDSSFDSWPYVDKYYLILNLAIGGFWGGAKGIDDAIFPARFAIRRVQIYQ